MKTEECEGPFPKDWPKCSEIFAGWVVGGGVCTYIFITHISFLVYTLRSCTESMTMQCRGVCE